jgi:hypothetical protein
MDGKMKSIADKETEVLENNGHNEKRRIPGRRMSMGLLYFLYRANIST